jgi:hypothetical protein
MINKAESKKGDLSVTILVVGIFAVCAFALLTFFISDFNISNSFVGVGVTNHVSSLMDQYLFYQNHGAPLNKLNSLFNVTEEYGKEYLVESKSGIQGGFLELVGGSKVTVFSIKYQIPSSAFLP